MNTLYAFLIVFFVYPILGTLLFASMEKLNIPVRAKVLILTFGHPLLTVLFISVVCSPSNLQVAETGVVVISGTLLRIPFSNKKYLTKIIKETGIITIEYVSELLKRKRMTLELPEIKSFEQSDAVRLFDKPSTLTVISSTQNLTFQILDNMRKISF